MRAGTIGALAGATVWLSLGCNGMSSTSGRHDLPSYVTANAAATAPASTELAPPDSASTPTVGTATPGMPVIDKSRDELRAIADTYVSTGDLATALAALQAKKATADELLATLRTRRSLAGTPTGGHQSLTITDGYGSTTDLQVEAPPTSVIQAKASQGLGLIVLLHGLGGNAGQTVQLGTELAATNDVVVVAPTAQPLPAGFAPEDGLPAAVAQQIPVWWMYESNHSFAMEAIRKACALFPIDRERVVIAGASMGGYGTWNIGLRHPDVFAAIAPMCGGLTRLAEAGLQDARSQALVVNGLMFPVWAAHGDADQVVPYAPDKQAADSLQAGGGDVTFHTLTGVGHDITSAIQGSGSLAAELRTFVTTKRRKAEPTNVVYCSAGETLDGAHWLRIAKRTAGVDRATIAGKIDEATNTITILGQDVELARVYLDERILDATRPVSIVVNGVAKWTGTIKTDMTAVLDSWKSREDEGLVYPAFAEVDPR